MAFKIKNKMAAHENARYNIYAYREAQAWAPKKKRLPVTLVTGFLGAGKTTLLTHILSNKHNLKIAAAVNDFASLNVDGQIVRGTGKHDEVVELSNGCLCCSVSGEFRKAVWQLLQSADIGKIDYLVVETSGVTDPMQTVATLEQDYGQMYRVRLDAVVTVVDGDSMIQKIEAGGGVAGGLGSVAADSQLRCADVVLINKCDLLSEAQVDRIKEFVEGLVPGVQTHFCSHCAVPLNWIMEVSEVTTSSQLVTHEVASAAYTISSVGGAMNQERHKRRKDDVTEPSGGTGHLSSDEFVSVVFESRQPLSLGKFQKFLGPLFPSDVVRMKGTVWFAEHRACAYSFHMSGRHRYELTPQLDSGLIVQLVAIGRETDSNVLRKTLEDCVAENYEDERQMSLERYNTVAGLIRANDYFIVMPQVSSSFVDFRVTGVIDYGTTEEEAAGRHGINFRRMNFEIAKRVNGGSSKISLLPVLLPDGVQVCRHSVLEESGFDEMWESVQPVAKSVVASFFQAVGVCKCGW